VAVDQELPDLMMKHIGWTIIVGAIISVFSLPVLADAIDGHWCHKDGRRMSSEGLKFVTPGGTSTAGEYDRHAYSYTVPDGEPGAGTRITMDLMHDDLIHLYIPQKGPGPAPVKTEHWERCDLTM